MPLYNFVTLLRHSHHAQSISVSPPLSDPGLDRAIALVEEEIEKQSSDVFIISVISCRNFVLGIALLNAKLWTTRLALLTRDAKCGTFLVSVLGAVDLEDDLSPSSSYHGRVRSACCISQVKKMRDGGGEAKYALSYVEFRPLQAAEKPPSLSVTRPLRPHMQDL